MKLLRSVVGAAVPALVVLTWSGTALGFPPANDNLAAARPVSVGFSEELDTREATTESFDTDINGDCGAPASDATVWYSYTASAEVNIVVDASRSDYSVGILIIPDPAKGFEEPSCAPRKWGFTAAAGETYYVMAMDDQLDGSGHGGTLRIEFRKEPTPTLEVTIDDVGRVNTLTGKATVRGTYRCTRARAIEVDSTVKQDVASGLTIWASGSDLWRGTCDGQRRVWSVKVDPSLHNGGKLTAGTAVVDILARACGITRCTAVPSDGGTLSMLVRLRPR